MGRPLSPPDLLMRSTAIWVPTSAVLPPAAAVPESGWSTPTLYGLACPNAARHGAGTSIVAPTAPAAAVPSPRNVRRVVLPLHHMSFAQGSSCHRSVIGSSLDARGCVVSRTKIALYRLHRLPDLTAQELPGLEGARVPSAVDQEVLTRHETGLGAADERAEVAELRGIAEAPGGVRPVAVADDLLDGPATGLRLDGDRRAQAVGVERTGEQVVDRDVVADGLACEPGDEAREPGARAVREPEDVDGVFHRARGYVDDPAEAAGDHPVDGRLDHENGRDHVRVDRPDPSVPVPVAEVARRRTARVVHEDVGLGAGGEHRGAPRLGRHVARDRGHAHAGGVADLLRRRLEDVLGAGDHRDVDALAGERQGARLAESLRRRTHDRAAPPDSHVHGALLLRPRARTRRAPA